MIHSLGNNLEIGQLVGGNTALTLPASARERHMYVCGGTGVGKSKFLEHCIRQDILNWRDSHCGLILLDPHGLVYNNIMAWLARHDLKRPVTAVALTFSGGTYANRPVGAVTVNMTNAGGGTCTVAQTTTGVLATDGPLTGTTSTNIGYNTMEDGNGASGLFGNGVNSVNLTGSMKVQPIPNGFPVWMRPKAAGTTQEYQFTEPNGIDGSCS